MVKGRGGPRIQKIFSSHILVILTAILVRIYEWPKRWLISGAPLLSYSLILGHECGYRILPAVPLWPLLATLNLVYTVAATSWFLYWVFVLACYPIIFLSCVFQFDWVANFMRRRLRSILRQLQFTNDKIAFFDIPALEIDTEVDGLMVVRGITFSLSSLTIIAHGIEVGIKLSDDLELAIQAQEVVVRLLRHIQISDVYANLKGGEYEMTFGVLANQSQDDNGDALMRTGSEHIEAAPDEEGMVKMKDELTLRETPKDTDLKNGLTSVSQLSLDDTQAKERYEETLREIRQGSTIETSRIQVIESTGKVENEEKNPSKTSQNDMLAAICSHLNSQKSISHPPRRSVKVTTLENLTPPWLRNYLHRLPMLLRLLLNLLSYFHTISVDSITATASGDCVRTILQKKVFEHFSDGSAEIRRIETRVLAWLSDAKFAIQLVDIKAHAYVPLMTSFKLDHHLASDQVMAYRLAPESKPKHIVQLGGADASISLPSFLLPHHEHILPPLPSKEQDEELEQRVHDAPGLPKTIQAQQDRDQNKKDETNMDISVHAKLPACIDQEILDFTAAIVKATKLVEMERDFGLTEEEAHGFNHYASRFTSSMKHSITRAAVDVVANDRWIARLVGRIITRLETAQGEIGYSGKVPIPLRPYRDKAESEAKLLP